MKIITEHPISIGGACFFVWRDEAGKPVLRSELFRAENHRRATKGNWALWLSMRHLPKVKGSYCSWAAAGWPLPEGVDINATDDYGNQGRLPGSWIYATGPNNWVLQHPDNRKALERLGVDPAAIWMDETGHSRADWDAAIQSHAEYISDWISGQVL